MNPQPVVYRIYDQTGRLIYIGATKKLADRMSAHRSESWWYRLLDRVEWEYFPTIEAAFVAEGHAIRSEQPAFNVQHSGSYRRQIAESDLAVCREWVSRKPWRVGMLPVALRWLAEPVSA